MFWICSSVFVAEFPVSMKKNVCLLRKEQIDYVRVRVECRDVFCSESF